MNCNVKEVDSNQATLCCTVLRLLEMAMQLSSPLHAIPM